MRILAILILLLSASSAIGLSLYVEKKQRDARRYGTNELVKAIMQYNESHESGTQTAQPEEKERSRQIIQYGGGVITIPPSSEQHTTYYSSDNSIPATNEGQPGQPLPLTGRPPPLPVYK